MLKRGFRRGGDKDRFACPFFTQEKVLKRKENLPGGKRWVSGMHPTPRPERMRVNTTLAHTGWPLSMVDWTKNKLKHRADTWGLHECHRHLVPSGRFSRACQLSLNLSDAVHLPSIHTCLSACLASLHPTGHADNQGTVFYGALTGVVGGWRVDGERSEGYGVEVEWWYGVKVEWWYEEEGEWSFDKRNYRLGQVDK